MAADSAYASLALAAVPRLLSKLDRERHSISYGSFDREHWGWKFRDFPIGPLQMGIYPLALLWRHPFDGGYRGNERLREWIAGAIAQTLSRQKKHGAFEAFAPNDFDPGPTLGICYTLSKTAVLLGDALVAEQRARVTDAVRRGVDFALRYEQAHGFASNHWALFACSYAEAASLTGNALYSARAREIIQRIMQKQSPDGWYEEYGGADPGYESLGIAYLAHYWAATRDTTVLDSLRRSIEFFAHCVHPDGSVGGIYGSRHTSLYFPAGFELLNNEVPRAAAVARFMRARLTRGNIATPATTDAHNLVPLVASYLEAALSATETPVEQSLPFEREGVVRHFRQSGISAVATARYYAVVNARKGGVCRVFDRQSETLKYEDAGYMAHAGRRRWISQTLGIDEASDVGDELLTLQTRFSEHRQLVPTAANYLALRILSLSLFRSVSLGAWIRQRIVRRLTSAARLAPMVLRRRIAFERDVIAITDELELTKRQRIGGVTLMRAHTGIHAGSAKYYHPSDMLAPGDARWRAAAAELTATGRALVEIRIEFGAPSER